MNSSISRIIAPLPAFSLVFRLLAFSTLLLLSSCIDQNFDESLAPDLPPVSPNTTISQLKALHKIGGDDTRITEDLIIGGVVVADDRSGNFFKVIVIEDATGGLTVRLNSVGLYNRFPIGTQVAIRCKDLYIGDYNGLIQLNGSPDEALEELLIEQHVFAGEKDQTVEPKTVSIDQLGDDLVNRLIRLENVQFSQADAGKPFADAVNKLSVNLNLEDCNGKKVIVRSSGFADFAATPSPQGKGTLVAVLSVFGTTKQLLIRQLSDLSMEGERCSGSGGGSGKETLISLADLRKLYTGTKLSLPADRKISGVVISDASSENTDTRNAVVQDAGGGIVLRFTENHGLKLGDQVEVVVSGQELSEFNGLLQVSNIPVANAASKGAGTLPSPRTATIAQLKANLEAWESTLVEVKEVTLSGNATFNGSLTVTDASGTTVHFTRSRATFSAQAVPSGKVDLIAILSQFNEAQLVIRNLNDVKGGTTGGGNGGGNTGGFSEGFTSQKAGSDLNLAGWINKAAKGTRLWRAEAFNGNLFAQATSFRDNSPELETWLISPEIDLSGANVLSFETAQAFFKHDGLAVLISTNFDGQNISAATWTPLKAKLASSADANYDWVPSGNIDLSAYSGKVRIAFRYTGDNTNNTTTFRVDNVAIRKN